MNKIFLLNYFIFFSEYSSFHKLSFIHLLHNKPLLICLTPIKNESWCLNLFLTITSLWADFIIIADQNSSDKSKDICSFFSKVIYIENSGLLYNEEERQSLLINKAREIEGDKILFALDADEIFPMDFDKTEDWQIILNSKPGDVFGFRWANIVPNQKNYYSSTFFYPWVFHDDGVTPHGRYVKEMHSMRIPFPHHADNGWYHVKQFSVLHLAHIFTERVYSKWRFYQCLELYKGLFNNPISSYRSYNYHVEQQLLLPSEWVTFLDGSTFFEQLNLSSTEFWFDDEVIEMFKEKGCKFFSILPIWESNWISKFSNTHFKLTDPRTFSQKLLHKYLELTQLYYPGIIIRLFDAIFKRVYTIIIYFNK